MSSNYNLTEIEIQFDKKLRKKALYISSKCDWFGYQASTGLMGVLMRWNGIVEPKVHLSDYYAEGYKNGYRVGIITDNAPDRLFI